jgi:DNA-binding response OmpR family regulator
MALPTSSPAPAADELIRLRDRVTELEDRVEELKHLLGITHGDFRAVVMHTFRLSPTQATLAVMFYTRNVWSREAIEIALYDDLINQGKRHPSVVDVHIRQLRQRLAPFDIEIATRREGGWQMSAEMKLRFEEKLRGSFLSLGG